MPYAKIEPSGCEVWHGGLVKVRFDLFLTPEDKRYDERHTLVPVIPESGYPGKMDKEGNPKDQADYDAWIASLPHIWRLAPFHSHFLRFEPDVSQDEILSAIDHHIPNFYAAWLQELDKQKGGMRKGWDVATRPKAVGRPRRYDREMTALELESHKLACLDKVNLIKVSGLSISSTNEGEIFPATLIDIGALAIGRDSTVINLSTYISLDNPANDTGSLDTIEIWPNSSLEGAIAGTFYGSDIYYTSRDYEEIGDVAGGDKRTFTGLDCDVETGDFIGLYYAEGKIERDYSGFLGLYVKAGDQFGAGQQFYELFAGDAQSVYGTGETVPEVTEKTSSDTGSGVDAKKTGNPLATYSRSETGSGVEGLPARGLFTAQTGTGVEHILDRALVLISESGSGVDTVLSLLGKLVSESGTGVENSYLHILEGVKSSSDSGSGAEVSTLAALFQRDETGEGVEAVVARALFSREPQMGAIDLARVLTAAITGAETGTGAEASLMAYYQKKDDSGEGVDSSTLEALFTGEDSGAGVEAITLLAAMVAHDTGVGVEAVIAFFRKLIDSGEGEENLHLIGYIGRAMKLITYLRAYSDLRVYTRKYSNLTVYTSEVKQ